METQPNNPETTPNTPPNEPIQPGQPSPNEDQNLGGNNPEVDTTKVDNTEVDLDKNSNDTYQSDEPSRH